MLYTMSSVSQIQHKSAIHFNKSHVPTVLNYAWCKYSYRRYLKTH